MAKKYFLIEPKEKLLKFVNEKYPLSGWNKPIIWEINQGIYRGSRKMLIPRLKLIFMADIAPSYRTEGIRNIPVCEIIEYVFGKPPEYSIDKFNEAWSLNPVERGLRNWESTLFHMQSRYLHLLKSTGDKAIDGWVENIIELKERFEQMDDENQEKKKFMEDWRGILGLDEIYR